MSFKSCKNFKRPVHFDTRIPGLERLCLKSCKTLKLPVHFNIRIPGVEPLYFKSYENS
jgi:hypothetical protein